MDPDQDRRQSVRLSLSVSVCLPACLSVCLSVCYKIHLKKSTTTKKLLSNYPHLFIPPLVLY